MRSEAETVDQYIEELEGERREAITRLRELLLEAVPGLKESMNYGMPTYTRGEELWAFASQKQYIALYLNREELVEKYKGRLGKVNAGKICLRFRRLKNMDFELIREMLEESAKK